jgi:hypothetical protein
VKRSEPTQVRPKPVLIFAAQALLLAVVLGYWSAPRSHYPEIFHAHATPILAGVTGRPVHLEAPAPGSERGGDTVMKGYQQGAFRPVWVSQFSVVRIGYWPSLLLAALLLATPLAPLRRALALVAGLALFDLVVLGRIGLEIAYAYFEFENGPGQAAQGALHLLLRVGSESLTATIPSGAAVLVIWVLLANPRRNLDVGVPRALMGRPAGPAPAAEPVAGDRETDAPADSRGPS